MNMEEEAVPTSAPPPRSPSQPPAQAVHSLIGQKDADVLP
jgi:hypothetical protein